MNLGKSPLSSFIEKTNTRLEKITANVKSLASIIKKEGENEKTNARNAKTALAKKRSESKRFTGIKAVLGGIKKKAEKATKSFLDKLLEMLIKGLAVGVLALVATNWKTIQAWWNKTRDVIDGIIDQFNKIKTFFDEKKEQVEENVVKPVSKGISKIYDEKLGGSLREVNQDLDTQMAGMFGGKKVISAEPQKDKSIKVTLEDKSTHVVKPSDPNYEDLKGFATLKSMSWQGIQIPGFVDSRSPVQKFTDIQRQIANITEEANKSQTTPSRKIDLEKELVKAKANLKAIGNLIKRSGAKLSESGKAQSDLSPELLDYVPTVGKQLGGFMGESTITMMYGGSTSNNSSTNTNITNIFGPGGGLVTGAIKDGDTVPALLGKDDYVLNRNAVKAMGGAQKLAKIGSSAPSRLQKGGLVPAMLEHGEYVIGGSTVKKIGLETLDELNFTHAPRFQKGGTPKGEIAYTRSVNDDSNRFRGGDRKPTERKSIVERLFSDNSIKPHVHNKREKTVERKSIVERLFSDNSIKPHVHRKKEPIAPRKPLVERLGFGSTKPIKRQAGGAVVTDGKMPEYITSKQFGEWLKTIGFTPSENEHFGGVKGRHATKNHGVDAIDAGYLAGPDYMEKTKYWEKQLAGTGAFGSQLYGPIKDPGGHGNGENTHLHIPTPGGKIKMTPGLFKLMKGMKLDEAGRPDDVADQTTKKKSTKKKSSGFFSFLPDLGEENVFGTMFEPIATFFTELGTALTTSLSSNPEQKKDETTEEEPSDPTKTPTEPTAPAKPKKGDKPKDLISSIADVVRGGEPEGDSVPSLLERGEGILNKNAVAALGGEGAISAINTAHPRFGPQPSNTTRLMASVNTGTQEDEMQPQVKVIRASSAKKKRPAPVNPSSSASEADLPTLPSFPPSQIMGTLAFNLPGTTHGLYS